MAQFSEEIVPYIAVDSVYLWEVVSLTTPVPMFSFASFIVLAHNLGLAA